MRARRLLAAVLLSACTFASPPAAADDATGRLVPAEIAAFPDDQPKAALLAALAHQHAYLARVKRPAFRVAGTTFTRAEMLRTVTQLERAVRGHLGTPAFDDHLRRHFRVLRLEAPRGTSLVTGYFAPEVRVSAARTERYRHPVYHLPRELARRGAVGPTRAEIEAGALGGRGLEFAYADDLIDLYWLHVQGSGYLLFDNGRRRVAAFAGTNGREYVSIGKLLLERGALGPGEATHQGIDRYLRAHPEEAPAILAANPRYVFFRLADGPIRGAGNIPLTAMRSVAADLSVLPLGAVCYLVTRRPVFSGEAKTGTEPAAHFVLVQDEGAAIQGPGRLDLFTGEGVAARLLAGHLGEPGEVYVVVAR